MYASLPELMFGVKLTLQIYTYMAYSELLFNQTYEINQCVCFVFMLWFPDNILNKNDLTHLLDRVTEKNEIYCWIHFLTASTHVYINLRMPLIR